MSRRPRPQTEGPGQDSFLDIVANLVGILIILVMVIGARAKTAWVVSRDDPQAEARLAELKSSWELSQNTTAALERDINDLDERTQAVQAATKLRAEERSRVQFVLASVERQIADRRQALDGASREEFDLRRELLDVDAELKQLADRTAAVESAAAPTAIIEHLPTPMARTVFGQEVHFQMRGGRLTYVPMEELIEEMKSEMVVKAEKLRHSSHTTETVGPIAGFHLRYRLRLAERTERTDFGILKRQLPEFAGFHLIPVSDALGEPFAAALKPGSEFLSRIERLNPESATITVWVYPDGFDDFRTLKRELFNRGFLTASWPLPAGQPIAGGPDGRRSAAQ